MLCGKRGRLIQFLNKFPWFLNNEYFLIIITFCKRVFNKMVHYTPLCGVSSCFVGVLRLGCIYAAHVINSWSAELDVCPAPWTRVGGRARKV